MNETPSDAPEELPAEADLPDEKGVAPESASLDFRCENCAAVMAWCPDEDALSCEFCGGRREVPTRPDPIQEYGLHEAGEAATGLGLELRAARCEVCGASVAFDTTSVSESCVFCGSSRVLAEEARRNSIRPESLVPIDVSRADVQASFRRWIKGLWFRPSALKKLKDFDGVGVYVPFWTFDCHAQSDWTAQAGYHYYVSQTYTTRVNGKTVVRTRRVRKTRWVPAAGERDDDYDDLPIVASRGIDKGLADQLGEFDAAALVPYRPEYLAGWAAEEYSVSLENGWKSAARWAESIQESRCAGDVPGDTHRSLHVRTHLSEVRWKHVLFPVWSLTFRFGGKVYPVLVHGQTGRVVGKAPYSWWKITLFVLLVLAIVGGGAFVVSAARTL